jgi:methionyl aminopeptidase
MTFFCATPEEQKLLRTSGTILAGIMRELIAMVRPGITTQSLEDRALELIHENNVQPSFLGYGGYPAALCTSVNDEAVHVVPSERIIAEGDLLKIDCGVAYQGHHTDTAATVLVTDGSKRPEYVERATLMRVTREALYAGIAAARGGNRTRDISRAIQQCVEKNNFTIVRELGGHGVGHSVHEEPFISNREDSEYDHELLPGMVLAIEPITSTGGWRIKDGPDGHALVMKDGSLSAHFEHTIIVTATAPLIITE